MEEEILQTMIRDREGQLKMIKRRMEEQTRKVDRLKADLSDVKAKAQEGDAEQNEVIYQLHQRHHQLLHQLKDAREQHLDMMRLQQGTQLHLYSEIMKNVTTPACRESSYALRAQSQLCKAMHSMGTMETQLAMMNGQAELSQKYMRERMTEMVEEKSQVELKLMNDLVLADNARREVETKHTGMVQSFSTEKDALLEKIEKQNEKEDDEEEEEEDDDEEKEELQEILSQGREEIERMEQENKQELDKLEELKARVSAVKGEEFVEELVSTIAEEFKERERDEEDEDEEDED